MFRSVVLVIALLLGVLLSPVAAQNEKTVPPALLQYVRDAQKAGLNPTQIRQNALKVGWPQGTVDDALETARETSNSKTPPQSGEKPAEEKQSSTATFDPSSKPGAPAGEPSAKPANPSDSSGGNPAVAPAGPPTSANSADETNSVKPGAAFSDEYQIGEGDVLQISVWDEPKASVPIATVRSDGKISMPLIKELMVAGLTPAQLEAIIRERLSSVIRQPEVTVIVSQINSKKIYFIGAVRREGPLKYTYRMTVMQAISEAGGLTDYAKRKNIYILHNENGRQYKLPFNYIAVLRGESMEQNIVLSPGDSIIVPQ